MRTALSRAAGLNLTADVAALVIFVTIGLVSHHHGFLRGYARDLPAFLGCWLGAAFLFELYRRPEVWRLAATWALGVPLAVLLRALIVGHALNGSEAAFLAVSLVTVAVLVAALRFLLRRLSRRAFLDASAPRR